MRGFSFQPPIEASIAFLASIGFFLLTAAIPIRGDVVPIVLLGCVYVYVVVLAARWGGPLYAVPLAIAGGLGFDSFYIPPTREFGASQWQNWLVVFIYISLGMLIGVLGSHAQRRAEASERARGRLADDQAALRRVATLVAEGSAPEGVFNAVAREVGLLLGVDAAQLRRRELDGTVSEVASWSRDGRPTILGMSSVEVPIDVEGRPWGTIAVLSGRDVTFPADTRARTAAFTELVGTAIANADNRAQLTASRARLLTAGDEARRRVARDLHDGAQQRLVHTIVTLRLAEQALREGNGEAEELVSEALEQAERGNAELRELAHGILPSALTRGGLRAGVATVVKRVDLPVEVDIPDQRFPPEVEANAYFMIAEALTNVVKHSQAGQVAVLASPENGTLKLEVRDDGVGGADRSGHGIVGLADRMTALGGGLEVESPPEGGTRLTATLPL